MKKLAIVGSGTETRDLAPWDDQDFEIWVFNEAPQQEFCKRWDAVFQMHPEEVYTGPNSKVPDHWDWLQKTHEQKPIYMQTKDARVPNAVAYPLDEVIGLTGFKYLQSSVAYALALAVWMGYEDVHVWGVEMSFSEYKYQAENFRFWVGFAMGRTNLVLHSAQKMFDGLLYGYEGGLKFGRAFFEERAAVLAAQWEAAEKNAKNVRAAINRAVMTVQIEKTKTLITNLQDSWVALGKSAGALAQAERYQDNGDHFADRGAFEYNAALAQREGEPLRVEMYVLLGQAQYVYGAWQASKDKRAADQLLAFVDMIQGKAEDLGAQLGAFEENVNYINKYDAMAKAIGHVEGNQKA